MKKTVLTFMSIIMLTCILASCKEKQKEQKEQVNTETTQTQEPKAVEDEKEDNEVYQVVDQMPEFPGGMEALEAFIKENIHYPDSAKNNNMQGRVIVSFVVNKDGSIADPVVIRSADHIFDDEAITVIRSMPKWIPGKMNGETVRVQFTVPVTFRL
ncbi:MAG: energy transducer TonB [Bacteroidaceae bacterium]|nr:energy transducer TonB [Bacteroidaceae bacterium]